MFGKLFGSGGAKEEKKAEEGGQEKGSFFSSFSSFASAVKDKVEKSSQKVTQTLKEVSSEIRDGAKEIRTSAMDSISGDKKDGVSYFDSGDKGEEDTGLKPIWYYPADKGVEDELKAKLLEVSEPVQTVEGKAISMDCPEYHYFMKIFGREEYSDSESVLSDPVLIEFARAASHGDMRLGRVRYYLVPKHVKEGQFWRSFQKYVDETKDALISQHLRGEPVPSRGKESTSEGRSSLSVSSDVPPPNVEVEKRQVQSASVVPPTATSAASPPSTDAVRGASSEAATPAVAKQPEAAVPVVTSSPQVDTQKKDDDKFWDEEDDEEDLFVSEEPSHFKEGEVEGGGDGVDLEDDDDDWEEELKRELEELKKA